MLFIFNSVSSVMNFCNYCKWPYPVAKFTTYASCSTWWPNLQLMQVVPPDGKIYSKCKFCHLMTTFTTYASGATGWPNLQLMQAAPPGGQIHIFLQF